MPTAHACGTTAAPIRVLIIDDHLSVLWGLERLIETAGDSMVVVGKATNTADALQLAGEARPDVVLLDVALNDEDGISAIPELTARSQARVLAITGERGDAVRDRAMLAGACGVVGKEEPPANILRAIEKVRGGEIWLGRSATGRVFMQLAGMARAEAAREQENKAARLTPREHQIAGLVATDASLSLRAIARKQHISESTLRNHLTSIYAKLGVAGRLELYVYASRNALSA